MLSKMDSTMTSDFLRLISTTSETYSIRSALVMFMAPSHVRKTNILSIDYSPQRSALTGILARATGPWARAMKPDTVVRWHRRGERTRSRPLQSPFCPKNLKNGGRSQRDMLHKKQ